MDNNETKKVEVEVEEPKKPTILVELSGILSQMEDIRKELVNGTLSYHDLFE